jgi:hypothetical protein
VRCLIALALLAIEAEADDETTGITIRAPERWQNGGPLLDSSPRATPNVKGLGVSETTFARIVERGPARVAVRGSSWTCEQALLHAPGVHLDVPARGWETGLDLSYDLGPFRLGGHLTQGFVDSAYARGAYRDVGISISRTFTLSRWMHAWISLGVSRRNWLDEKPPPGETEGTTLMLSVGTTFR